MYHLLLDFQSLDLQSLLQVTHQHPLEVFELEVHMVV
nr:MAG TPA: hypothetical protein [Myoviridae sp. ctfA14]